MTNMRDYCQAATDFRSNIHATRRKGLAILFEIAGGPNSPLQRQALKIAHEKGIHVEPNGTSPDFSTSKIVPPAQLTR